MKSKQKKIFAYLFSIFFVILSWSIFAKIIGSKLILPTPLDVFYTIINLCTKNIFWQNVLVTMGRTFSAFFIKFSVIIILGIYLILSGLSFFIAFIKPILCVSCVYIIFFEIKNIYECVINKSYKVVLFGILLLVESLFPFFIEAMWFYSYNFFIWFVLSIIYVLYVATKTRRFSPEYWLNELKRVFKTK